MSRFFFFKGLDEQMTGLSMPSTPSAAPSSGKKGKAKSEADELRELEAAMAL
jgi:hypothetical protein